MPPAKHPRRSGICLDGDFRLRTAYRKTGRPGTCCHSSLQQSWTPRAAKHSQGRLLNSSADDAGNRVVGSCTIRPRSCSARTLLEPLGRASCQFSRLRVATHKGDTTSGDTGAIPRRVLCAPRSVARFSAPSSSLCLMADANERCAAAVFPFPASDCRPRVGGPRGAAGGSAAPLRVVWPRPRVLGAGKDA